MDGVSVKSTLTHPDLIITHKQGGKKTRSYVQLVGLSPDRGLGIFNGDIDTIACALLERMYFCKVKGRFESPPNVLRETTIRLNRFRNKVLRNCGSPSVLTLEQVVDTYTGRKRTIYQNALETLYKRPLSRRDSYSIAFVKVEKGKPGKAPRVIQPRDPRYNLYVGKYIKACEKRIYRAIAKTYGDGPTVMKGYNVDDIGRIIHGKWKSFRNPVALGLDAVKFDMHVSAAALSYEHGFYHIIFNNYPELKTLLKWQINNRGYAYAEDGKLRYKVKGRRFSGDMNTALGNCIIMCALVHTYSYERGIHVKLVNNGDDCVVFLESDDLLTFSQSLEEWFYEFGFRMTVETPVREIERIEFCQMHPVWVGNNYRMVRNVKTALAKDTMTVLPITNSNSAKAWFKAIGECGLSLTSGIPVMQAFYAMYDRQTPKRSKLLSATAMQTGMQLLSKGMVANYQEPTPESRVSFWTAFGLTPDEQRAYEELFDNYVINSNTIEPADRNFIPYYEI